MPDILTKQDGPHPHPPTFLQFTDQSVVCFGARLFARQQSKHDPTISSFFDCMDSASHGRTSIAAVR
jgi:hypothetical protein